MALAKRAHRGEDVGDECVQVTINAALWANHPILVQGFHVAIVNALNASWAACTAHGRSPHEPDLVAGLVLNAAPAIYQHLSASLRPYGIIASVSSVFCHQSPKVRHSGPHPGSCELGDILFVYSHRPQQGPPTRNALLLQAKSASRHPYTVAGSGSERVQLDLYETWPRFTYATPASLQGKARDVQPKSPSAGAQYLLLDSGHPSNPGTGLLGQPGTFPAGCCIPGQQLHIHTDLANELFELLLLKSGRPFGPKGTSGDDWSNVIWDLIQIGLAKAFNRRLGGHINAPRYSGGPILFEDGSAIVLAGDGAPTALAEEALGRRVSAALYSDGEAGIPKDLLQMPNDDGDGVSIVLVETRQIEGQ